MYKRFWTGLLVVLLLLPAPVNSADTAAGTTAVIHHPTVDAAPLYTAPSDDYRPFGYYYNGTPVSVSGTDGRWSAVTIGSPGGGIVTGYIETTCLTFDPAADPVPAAIPVLTIQNGNGTGLNLRRTPIIDPASLIRLYPNGTQVLALGVWDGWLHVQVDDTTGYMQTFGFRTGAQEPRPGTGAPAASQRFDVRRTVLDSHGYTVTAAVTEAPPGQYAVSVRLAFNGVILNGILIGYNVYADGEFLGCLDIAGRVTGNPESAPNAFANTFTASPSIAGIELRSVWSRSGTKRDAEENTVPDDYMVLYRK